MSAVVSPAILAAADRSNGADLNMDAAYRRLALTILRLDVATLAAELVTSPSRGVRRLPQAARVSVTHERLVA